MSGDERPLRDRIRVYYDFLVNELRVSLYLDALYGKSVICDQDRQQLQALDDTYKQARHLLDVLKCKPENTIAEFFSIIEEKGEQPQIIAKIFPEGMPTEQQDGMSKESDSDNAVMSADTLAVGPPEDTDPEWEGLVVARLPALVSELRPSLLLDHLRAAHLINREEYRQLQKDFSTEKKQSQELVHNMLPEKGKGSFVKFCEVLGMVEGQQHIVTEILKAETTAVSNADKPSVLSAACLPSLAVHEISPYSTDIPDMRQLQQQPPDLKNNTAQASDASSTAANEISECQQHEEICASPIDEASLSSTPMRKRKHSSRSYSTSEKRQQDYAIFFVKEEHQELIEDLEQAIRGSCIKCFGIRQVTVIPAELAELKTMLKNLGHPLYMDVHLKLGVLVLYGVDRQQVDSRCTAIIDTLQRFIVSYIRTVNPDIEVPAGDCIILQTMLGTVSVVFQLTSDFYLFLFCALGIKERQIDLSNSLQKVFPGVRKVVFRLGGLPPLQLVSGLTDTDENVAAIQTSEQIETASSIETQDQDDCIHSLAGSILQATSDVQGVSTLSKEQQPSLQSQFQGDTGATLPRWMWLGHLLGIQSLLERTVSYAVFGTRLQREKWFLNVYIMHGSRTQVVYGELVSKMEKQSYVLLHPARPGSVGRHGMVELTVECTSPWKLCHGPVNAQIPTSLIWNNSSNASYLTVTMEDPTGRSQSLCCTVTASFKGNWVQVEPVSLAISHSLDLSPFVAQNFHRTFSHSKGLVFGPNVQIAMTPALHPAMDTQQTHGLPVSSDEAHYADEAATTKGAALPTWRWLGHLLGIQSLLERTVSYAMFGKQHQQGKWTLYVHIMHGSGTQVVYGELVSKMEKQSYVLLHPARPGSVGQHGMVELTVECTSPWKLCHRPVNAQIPTSRIWNSPINGACYFTVTMEDPTGRSQSLYCTVTASFKGNRVQVEPVSLAISHSLDLAPPATQHYHRTFSHSRGLVFGPNTQIAMVPALHPVMDTQQTHGLPVSSDEAHYADEAGLHLETSCVRNCIIIPDHIAIGVAEQLHISIPAGSNCVIPPEGCLVQFISNYENEEIKIEEVAGDRKNDREVAVVSPAWPFADRVFVRIVTMTSKRQLGIGFLNVGEFS